MKRNRIETRIPVMIGLFLTIGFSLCQAQQFEWARRIGGAGEENCRTMALDNQGNIYLAGTFQGTNVDFDPGSGNAGLSSTGGSIDIFIAKYDSSGNYLWARKIGGAGEDIPGAIELDGSDNVLIGGWFTSAGCDFDPGPGIVNLSSAGLTDIFFAKYDTNGNYIWVKSMGSTGYDGCHDIRADITGNVFITGYFAGSVDFDPGNGTATLTDAGGGDLFFAKFDQAGNLLWARRAGGSLYEVGNGINIDHAGNIYISGPFYSPDADFDPGAGTAILRSAGGADIYLAKYDAAGNYLWAHRTGGNADELGGNVEIDGSGNLIVLGVYQSANIDFDPGPGTKLLSSAGSWDISVSKFTPAGSLLWVIGFGSPGDEYYTGLTIDKEDHFYLSGLFSNTIDLDWGPGTAQASSAGGYDGFFAYYDPNGGYLWSMTIGGSANDNGGPVVYDSGHLCAVQNFKGTGVDMNPGRGTTAMNSAGATDLAVIKFSLHLQPDSINRVVFSNTSPEGNSEIYTVYADGTGLTRLTNTAQQECGPAWSPDGSRIAFHVNTNDLNGSQFIMDADGQNAKRLTDTPNVCDGPPAWSPDGKYIAFGRGYPLENDRTELWMMNSDGTNQHRVGTFSGDQPCWSPDGSKLVICLKKTDRSCIATVNPDGSGLLEISSEGTENSWPAWSPDGDRIAFQSNRSGDPEIYVIRADGTNPVRLTNHQGEDAEPDWSPDGMRIAYSSMVGGRNEIRVMNTDDARPYRLAGLALQNVHPAWKPAASTSSHHPDGAGEFSLFQNYPNPTNGPISIGFNQEKEGHVLLDVLDASGRPVFSRDLGMRIAGEHRLSVDLTGLTPGQYFYKLTSGKNALVKKLVKY
jgi:Tol biopolymer transport system component